mgnify:CR=1 FL=1
MNHVLLLAVLAVAAAAGGLVLLGGSDGGSAAELSFDLAGGSGDCPPVASDGGSAAIPPGYTPEMEHHTFLGWRSPEGILYQPGSSVAVAGDTELTATWRPWPSYTLSFDLAGGSGDCPTVTRYYDAAGPRSVQVPPTYAPVPPDGMCFAGWEAGTFTDDYPPYMIPIPPGEEVRVMARYFSYDHDVTYDYTYDLDRTVSHPGMHEDTMTVRFVAPTMIRYPTRDLAYSADVCAQIADHIRQAWPGEPAAQAQMACGFVQTAISYDWGGYNSHEIGYEHPPWVVYHRTGVCEATSYLLAGIYACLGFNTYVVVGSAIHTSGSHAQCAVSVEGEPASYQDGTRVFHWLETTKEITDYRDLRNLTPDTFYTISFEGGQLLSTASAAEPAIGD